VNPQNEIAASGSKSLEKHMKEIEAEIRAVTNRTNTHKKSYYAPVSLTNFHKEGKSTRSNSRTKTVSVKKVNFVKNASANLNVFRKVVNPIVDINIAAYKAKQKTQNKLQKL
jgi:hypothetical protein